MRLTMLTRLVAVIGVLAQPFSHVQSFTLSMTTMSANAQKPKLWDTPVSNNGARCRCALS